MFGKPSIKSVVRNVGYLLAGMVLAALFFADGGPGSRLFPQEAHAAERPLAPKTAFTLLEAPESETWVICTPIVIGTFNNRVHVRCAQSYGGVDFFAAPTSNPANAARVLSTISTAQIAGRTLNILYDPDDLSGSDYNCDVGNCRALHAVEFGQ